MENHKTGPCAILVVLAVGIAVAAYAGSALAETSEATRDQFMSATKFRCIVEDGATIGWTKGQPKVTSGRWGDANVILIDSIDVSKKTARLIRHGRTFDLQVLAGQNELHFIEMIERDSLGTLTVLNHTIDGGYVFMYSRHNMLWDIPGAGLYPGTCEIYD